MSARITTTIICDACGMDLITTRTTTTGARGDAERMGWRVSQIGDGYRSAGRSSDPKRRDECPRCRTDRPAPDIKPEGALL